MKKQKRWLSNGLLAFGSLIAALGVTEGAVRLLSPQPTGVTAQDRYGLALHYPGIARYLPQFGHEVSFNSVGMRDREHTVDKPPGVYRILLLGDSFMEALQVPFAASFPSLLERYLGQQTGKRIEVINAGVSGWGTDDELRYLTNYGLQYQPDLVVVVMTLHNDISDNLRQYWHRVQGGILIEQRRPPMSFVDYHVTRLKAYLSTRFQLYQLWRRVRHGGEIRQAGRQLHSHVVQLFEEPTPGTIAEGVTLTDLLLQQVQQETRAAGGRVVLVLLPIRYQLSDSVFADLVRSAGVPPATMQVDKPQRMITPLANGLGIPVIDLLPAFRKWTADSATSLYLESDGHWSVAGHQLAAASVADGLLRDGTVR
jgi:lysophospholipase L1-like esterase